MSKRTYEEYIKNDCHPVGYNEACQSYYFAQTSIDYILDQLDQQKAMWNELKEWLEEQQNNFKLISKTLGKTDYVLLSNCIKSVLSEIAKLEG